MAALRNAAHLVILGIWATLGVLFAVESIFVAGALVPVIAFCAWFAAFAAVTTWVVRRFDTGLGALATHAVAFIVLNLVPTTFPLSLVRLGYDLLAGRPLPF